MTYSIASNLDRLRELTLFGEGSREDAEGHQIATAGRAMCTLGEIERFGSIPNCGVRCRCEDPGETDLRPEFVGLEAKGFTPLCDSICRVAALQKIRG